MSHTTACDLCGNNIPKEIATLPTGREHQGMRVFLRLKWCQGRLGDWLDVCAQCTAGLLTNAAALCTMGITQDEEDEEK